MIFGIWSSGKTKKPIEQLINTRNRPRALIMNVEALSSVRLAQQTCQAFLEDGAAMMVIDESTRIKNIDSKRTEAIIDLGKLARQRRILSGLPTPNSPLDIFAQMEFLDPDILNFVNYYVFRARYAILQQTYTGRMRTIVRRGKAIVIKEKVWTVAGYRNEKELREKIAPHSFRVLKSECLDLPPKVYEQMDIDLTDEQKRIYLDLKTIATSELADGGAVTATRVITRMIRLHQLLCGHTVDDETGEIRAVPSKRLHALLELISDHAGKAIIWATYDYSIREISAALTEVYGKDAVAQFWGGNANTRHLDEERFRKDPKCRFMVSTQFSGGLGNTWIEADLVVYYANSYDLEMRFQSEDRAHRGGQTKSVTYIDLVCPNTVDNVIISALRKKIDLAATITGDNYKAWLI